MRKYEDEQQTESVMFSGAEAAQLKELRVQMDKEAEEICQELHRALDVAAEKFAELGGDYAPKYQAIIATSELAGTPVADIGFDFSNAEKHGVVFAKRIPNPMKAFIDMLRKSVEAGPVPTADSIFVEPKQSAGESFSKRWDTRAPVDA